MVCVTQMISHIGNLTPRDVVMLSFFTIGNMTGCFADHFQEALKCCSADTILDKLIEFRPIKERAYVGDRLQDVLQAKGNSVDH